MERDAEEGGKGGRRKEEKSGLQGRRERARWRERDGYIKGRGRKPEDQQLMRFELVSTMSSKTQTWYLYH